MSACKQCGAEVRWVLGLGRPRRRCVNADDGADHWDRCSKERARIIRETGTPFEEKRWRTRVAGFKTDLKNSGEQLTRIDGITITGPRYRPPSGLCECDVAPWEPCLKSGGCPDRVGV